MGVEPENDMPDYLGSGQNMDVNLTYVVQDERLDLADANIPAFFTSLLMKLQSHGQNTKPNEICHRHYANE